MSTLVDALVFGRTVTRSVQRWEHGRAIDDELFYGPALAGDENVYGVVCADIRARSKSGATPLLFAACKGSLNAVAVYSRPDPT